MKKESRAFKERKSGFEKFRRRKKSVLRLTRFLCVEIVKLKFYIVVLKSTRVSWRVVKSPLKRTFLNQICDTFRP
jgi:hypothetical protein